MEPVTLTWPGGEDRFALRLGELRALQQVRKAGPEEIFNRLRTGRWEADDLTQVIRFGLVGGSGMKSEEAGAHVTALMDLHPLIEFKLTALAVLAHALMGDLEDAPEGAGDDAGKPETESREGAGGFPTSTEPAP